MANTFRERVLEHTLRELAEYGDVTEEDLAFVRTLDLPNITLAALRDMPNIADDGTVTFDDNEHGEPIQYGGTFNINSLQGYLDWEVSQRLPRLASGRKSHR
jgi:hypothetical protein